MKSRRRIAALAGLGLILLTAPASAQAPLATAADSTRAKVSTTGRPRIGLVLGGGGARGGAHIGVLQVLMELNVPIDYVVGTSMGAVIGSLYSVGLMPDEIEATLVQVDWDDLFNDRPDRQDRIFRRKQDDTADFLPIEWGWKNKGIVLASAAIAGQKLGFAFREPALYLEGHDGFDNLPTPFRAVTTDLQTGEMFVPDRGNLLKAVRASMSIPGVFPPVMWDGRRLVDGYLARNLPVDVGRDMGADIIIAVDVGALPEETDPESLHTIGGINEQKGYIGARQNVDPMLALADVVIQPDLTGISTRDFKRIAETIAPGREAALAVVAQLRELSLDQNAYLDHLRAHAKPRLAPVTITEVRLDNESVAADVALLANIHQPLGAPLDLDQLEKDLTRIYDFGVFELVDFTLYHHGEGFALEIIATPKYYAPHILNFGLAYLGGDGGESDFTGRVRWTWAELNKRGGEMRTDFQIGRTTGAQTEYYQPLTMNRVPFFSLAGRWRYHRQPWYVQMRQYGDYNVEQVEIVPQLGLRLGHYGEARFGLLYGRLHTSDRSFLGLGEFDGPRGGFLSSIAFDMLNRPVLPYDGWAAKLEHFQGKPSFGSDLDYHVAHATVGFALGTADDVFIATANGATNFHTNMPLFEIVTLGGLGRISGLHQDQLSGEVSGLGTVAYYRRLTRATSPYATSWYVGLQLEAGNAWYWSQNPGWDDLRYAGLISLVGTTFAGPLTISYGRTDLGNDALYISLGRLQHWLN